MDILNNKKTKNRFVKKLKLDPKSGCLEWQSTLKSNGYGEFKYTASVNVYKKAVAHKVYYTHIKGEIKDGMVLDHKCRNRKCVNPDHLRVVDRKTNCMENSISPVALNAKKTHCPKGHEYTQENTYHYRGKSRMCIRCRKEYYVNVIKVRNEGGH